MLFWLDASPAGHTEAKQRWPDCMTTFLSEALQYAGAA